MSTCKEKRKYSNRVITIGNSENDGELIDRILSYQKEKNLSSAAAAVRALCEDALAIKKAMR